MRFICTQILLQVLGCFAKTLPINVINKQKGNSIQNYDSRIFKGTGILHRIPTLIKHILTLNQSLQSLLAVAIVKTTNTQSTYMYNTANRIVHNTKSVHYPLHAYNSTLLYVCTVILAKADLPPIASELLEVSKQSITIAQSLCGSVQCFSY